VEEIAQLRTLWRRRVDILAFFSHHAFNGSTEVVNGRRDALRRNALGFRELIHYRWRSLLHSGVLPTCHGTLNYEGPVTSETPQFLRYFATHAIRRRDCVTAEFSAQQSI
jgi:hypothetical protein